MPLSAEVVARGQYGVEFYKKALEIRMLRGQLPEGNSFVVTFGESRLAFLKRYIRTEEPKAVGLPQKLPFRLLIPRPPLRGQKPRSHKYGGAREGMRTHWRPRCATQFT